MKKVTVLFAFFCLTAVFSAAPENKVFYDSRGRQYQSSKIGNTTTFRDSAGRIIYTAVKNGDTTIYRDGQGRYQGQKSTFGGVTTYRDDKGRVVGTKR